MAASPLVSSRAGSTPSSSPGAPPAAVCALLRSTRAPHGFHTIVVEDAVGDRAALPPAASLWDIEAKRGDVVSLDEARAYLDGQVGPN